MKDSLSKFSQEDILRAVEDGVISLSELSSAIRDKLDKTLVGNLPLEAIPMIEEFKEPYSEEEIARFKKVEDYLNNISHLRNESSKPTLKESNGKTYLVLGQDDIFEVIEQKGPIYIAYHPIKDMYIVYKFLGEDSNKNTDLLWGLDSIEKTDIEGYYRISSSETQTSNFYGFWETSFLRNVSYYYIGEDGEVQDFGYFRKVGDLNGYGNAVFFNGVTQDSRIYMVIHNGFRVKEIPSGFANTRKSKSGRHLLHFLHNFPGKNSTNSLFDLDNMKFIFEGANIFNFDISFSDDDVGTFENMISWEFHKGRKGISRLLGKEVKRYNTTL